MHGHRVHSYALEALCLYFAAALPLALLLMMALGNRFDRFKRGRRVARLAAQATR